MPQPTTWLVEFLSTAVRDLEALSSNRKERLAAYTAVDKLMALDPQLVPPHMKSLKGVANLMELRPRQGHSPVRLLYIRVGDCFKILAVACTHDELDAKVVEAERRAAQYGTTSR